ncbi:MAG: hypothetical protein ACXW4B_08725 [Micavibrio sp.]
MVARINTVALHGVDVQNVNVEVQIFNGLPSLTNVEYIISYINNMAKILCLLALFILSISVKAIADDSPKHVDYAWISKRAHALAAIPVNNGVTVFSSRLFLRFDDKINRADGYPGPVGEHFSGPLKFDGYAQFIKPLSSQSVVVAGLDYKAGLLASLSNDKRRNFILKMNPETLKVEKFIPLKDRVSYGLAVDKNDRIALLSGVGHGHYTLTVFDSTLKPIRSLIFGIGGKGDVAVTGEGNFVVIGFESIGATGLPTYWEFSPELKLIEQRTLSERTKSNGNTDGHMQILTHGLDAYLVYGWDDCPGCKKANSSVLWIEKVNGKDSIWKKEHKHSYHSRFFIFPDGNPFHLEPKKDAIYQTIFNKENGSVSTVVLDRPNSPIECFPPNLYYEVINAFALPSGGANLVLTSRPLDNNDAGCVTIGKVKL